MLLLLALALYIMTFTIYCPCFVVYSDAAADDDDGSLARWLGGWRLGGCLVWYFLVVGQCDKLAGFLQLTRVVSWLRSTRPLTASHRQPAIQPSSQPAHFFGPISGCPECQSKCGGVQIKMINDDARCRSQLRQIQQRICTGHQNQHPSQEQPWRRLPL